MNYTRKLSSGNNNTVIVLSDTEVAKLFTGDTRSEIGLEAEKMKFANSINSLVVKFIRLDAVHFKVRQDGKVVSKAAYNVLAVDLQGRKDLLGIYIGDAESARFWLSVLTDLQSRGVKDLLICSIDNLTGLGDAIETVFPQADVQLCLVHQMRTSMRYVVSKDQKAVAADLRPIYQSANLAGRSGTETSRL